MNARTKLTAVVVATLGTAGPLGAAPATFPVAGGATRPAVSKIALPGAPPTGVGMDYLAYDGAHHRVWVPAGNTGSVDVIDTASGGVTRIEGFATAQMERRGTKRTVGPSSATVGVGVVYVGNRADGTVCAVDATTLRRGACAKLTSMPDGLAYVASTKEVWVTTPRTDTLTILDAGTLAAKGELKLEGQPEGFAVDDARGVFYTNLEDKNRTLAIDVKARRVTSTWQPKCSEDGPKGLAFSARANFLFVACADQVLVMDAGHQGRELARLATGDGVDNIFFVEGRHELYVGAAHAARLTVARVDARGALAVVAKVPTAAGARNPVATDDGVAYLTDSPGGAILVVNPAAKP
ncbi:MAG TPA: hypothetical protein VGP07_05820 [Polyangia bacterium]|jgi:DNA-binding beta-propeller fold protein YncE